MAQQTLLDIAKLNGSDAVVGLIEEVVASSPEIAALPARTVKGTSFTTVARTSYPDVGFRAANTATAPGKSEFAQKIVSCHILSSLVACDKAVAEAYEDGVAAWQAIEAAGVLRQAFRTVGGQVFYGTDARGFPGLVQTYDAANMTVDATGSEDGECSSAWLLATGPQDVQLLFGGGYPLSLSNWRVEIIGAVPSYVSDLTGWVGLQVVNPHSAVRIKKLSPTAHLTDALVADAIAKFPPGRTPSVIFMSRRSRSQLWQSRTVTIFSGPGGRKPGGGVGRLAEMPTSVFGIPIVTTDSITDTEALTL